MLTTLIEKFEEEGTPSTPHRRLLSCESSWKQTASRRRI